MRKTIGFAIATLLCTASIEAAAAPGVQSPDEQIKKTDEHLAYIDERMAEPANSVMKLEAEKVFLNQKTGTTKKKEQSK